MFNEITIFFSIDVPTRDAPSFTVYRETRDIKWLNRGRACSSRMKLWAEQGCKNNFQQKMLLMLAEEHFSMGNVQQAKEFYSNAITSSNEHRFINDEALSYELAALFYLDTGDLSSSLQHFTTAHQKYEAWGALEKAHQLFAFVNGTFTGFLANGRALQTNVC